MSYECMASAFLKGVTVILALCSAACLVRAIAGPRSSDRLVAANMIGTQVVCIIAAICVISGESGFLDIAFIYAMLSFIATAVFSRVSGRKDR